MESNCFGMKRQNQSPANEGYFLEPWPEEGLGLFAVSPVRPGRNENLCPGPFPRRVVRKVDIRGFEEI